MISIQSSLTELERTHQQRQAVIDCYVTAIKNVAHYTVELDQELTAPHRKYLTTLAAEVASATPEAMVESGSMLRSLLRDYRDKAAYYMLRMRDELAGSTRALEQILGSLAQSDDEHETRLRGALGRLRGVANSPEASPFKTVVDGATDAIDQSLEQMRKQNQLTESQFLAEIRMLHKRIDGLEKTAAIDSMTGLCNRQEIEQAIRAASGSEYCLLLLAVRGIRRSEAQFSREVAEELAAAFTKRLRNGLPPGAEIGRWDAEAFVVMVSVPKSEAVARGKWITEHLSGAYACLLAGKSVRPALQVSVGIVDAVSRETPERILERVGAFLT
jgi:GGDEF domain-containing protein